MNLSISFKSCLIWILCRTSKEKVEQMLQSSLLYAFESLLDLYMLQPHKSVLFPHKLWQWEPLAPIMTCVKCPGKKLLLPVMTLWRGNLPTYVTSHHFANQEPHVIIPQPKWHGISWSQYPLFPVVHITISINTTMGKIQNHWLRWGCEREWESYLPMLDNALNFH